MIAFLVLPRIRALTSAALGAALALGGCASRQSVGTAELRSLGTEQRFLPVDLAQGCYAVEESESSFWFSSVDLESLPKEPNATPPDAVFMHVQLVWSPLPGRTPISADATNAVVRVVIVAKGQMGLYGGAAFAEHEAPLGADAIELTLRGGTLTLLESTPGFADPLSPAGLTASLRAERSAERALLWRRAVSQVVTNGTGKSTWVRNQQTPGAGSQPVTPQGPTLAHGG